ncbi:hypothetical protein DFR70_11833 [Nocardia tenerifensis]|uniref:Uncharacterized protein n=1 Tax=Nocardia tenerifensis TaxID=228006 RepID=A0A318JUL3_9NOCA|nr:hypothetical protein [Nocardia tenerifensis]PXX57378.1 hypothetical protein DFR70_11833 [Nocardia tenerifensis]
MTAIESGTYVGATAAELREKGTPDKAAGLVSQKALFHRRGKITLDTDTLVLSDWNDSGDLILRPTEITAIERKFTDLYGRFLGGLLDSGKPLILHTVSAGEIYLLIDRKEFMETTRNKAWAQALLDWHTAGTGRTD